MLDASAESMKAEVLSNCDEISDGNPDIDVQINNQYCHLVTRILDTQYKAVHPLQYETKHHNFGMLLNNGVATVGFVVELPLLTSLDVDIKAAKILTLSLLFTLDNFFLMGEANVLPNA